MDYEEFQADYDRVLDTSDQVPLPELRASIERLRGLAQTFTDPDERFSAENRVATLEGIYAYGVEDEQDPVSPAMSQAERVSSRAASNEGTTAERIARLRAGMDEIGRIADAADPAEKGAILDLNESLYMLRTALESRTS
jgi:hypothetical protein